MPDWIVYGFCPENRQIAGAVVQHQFDEMAARRTAYMTLASIIRAKNPKGCQACGKCFSQPTLIEITSVVPVE